MPRDDLLPPVERPRPLAPYVQKRAEAVKDVPVAPAEPYVGRFRTPEGEWQEVHYGELDPEAFRSFLNIPGAQNRAHPYDTPQGPWDYRTSRLGPLGQPLPTGAIGWDPDGYPYFGPGLVGYLRGAWSRLTAPTGETRAVESAERTEGFTYSGSGPSVTIDRGTSAVDLARIAATQVTEQGQPEGTDPTFFQYLGRGASEAIRAALRLLIVPSEVTERALGATLAVGEAGEGSPLPAATGPMQEAAQSFAAEGPGWMPPALRQAASFTSQITTAVLSALPPFMIYNGLRAITSGRTTREIQEFVGDRTEAARILYTTFIDPAAQQEFIRRADAGEDPQLLALELDNPVAEMAGQIIVDPLNMLFAASGRNLRDTRRATSASREFLNAADPAVARALDSLGDVSSQTRGAEALQDLADAHRAAIAAARTRQTEMAHDLGIMALSASGKRFHVSRRVGEMWEWTVRTILGGGGTPDDALDVVRGMVLAAGDDPADIAHGLGLMLRFDAPRPLFSPAGNDLAIVLREAMTIDGAFNPTRFLSEMANNIPDMIAIANRRMGTAIDRMFPTITERLAAGERVSPTVRALARFDALAQGKLYRRLNRFFSGIYMGMSPGYAFRNMWTNTVHVLVDVGPEAFRYSPSAWDARSSRWLGGQLPSGASLEFGPAAAADVRGGQSIFSYFLRRAARDEGRAGSRVVGVTVDRTMRQMLQPGRALPDIAPLMNAGMDRRAAMHLVQLVTDNYGDVRAATAQLRASLATGHVESWRTVAWVAPRDRAFLSGVGIHDEVADILRTATSREEAVTRLSQLEASVLGEAANAAAEAPAISRASDAIDAATSMGEARRAGYLSDDAVATWQGNAAANDAALGAYEDAVMELRDAALYSAGRGQVPIQEVEQLARQYDFRALRQQAREISLRYTDTAWEWTRTIKGSPDTSDWAAAWRSIGIAGEPPRGLSRQQLLNALWDVHTRPSQRRFWNSFRNQFAEISEEFSTRLGALTGVTPDTELLQRARQLSADAALWDNAVFLNGRFRTLGMVSETIPEGDAAVRLIAQQYGIPSADDAGRIIVGSDRHILNAINKYLPEGTEPFVRLTEVPPEVAQRAFASRGAAEGVARAEGRVLVAPLADGQVPSHSRVLYEQAQGIHQMFDRLRDGTVRQWGRLDVATINPQIDTALSAWETVATPRIAEARLAASQVANAARDFTLLAYPEKRYLDLALAYVYPYQFWHNRTYAHWLQRLAYNQDVIAAYGKYRRTLEQLHGHMPEWWRYNLNSNELLGLDSENPLFFNLEATMNPLQGLVGVDFNDPYRRAGWFAALLDDIGKFGPSTWTPYSIAVALALHMQGEEEAAARWAARLGSQTRTFKAFTSLLGLGGGAGIEADPFVLFFSGGVDPYERRRIGRALAAMVNEGADEAEAIDSARTRTGPLWAEAHARTVRGRAVGDLASFFLGVGFRPRSTSDIEIDQFYTEYHSLFANEPNMSPEVFRSQMDLLRTRYPFMDTLILAQRGTDMRDRAYAYNVLGRLPPGQISEFAGAAGIDGRLIERFYDDKGHIEEWDDGDRMRFMAGMIDLGAILAIPPTATREEWGQARGKYREMRGVAEQRFGESIWDRVDAYYGALSANEQLADAMLERDPQIREALTFQQLYIQADRLLAAYYDGINQLERYYMGQMYAEVERTLGSDIWDKWDEYYRLQDTMGDHRAYWRAHPELAEYREIRSSWLPLIEDRVVSFGRTIEEIIPAEMRTGVTPLPGPQTDIAGLTQDQRLTWPEWQAALGEPLSNLVIDYLGGEELPSAARTRLRALADELGMSFSALLAEMSRSALTE